MDYDAIAQQFGGVATPTPVAPTTGAISPNANNVNYDALAQQFGGVASPMPAGAELPEGSLERYAAESANPASTAQNPDPSWWDRLVSGTPLAPITPEMTSTGTENKGVLNSANQSLKLVGHMFANILSDAPGAAAGIASLFEPWKWPEIVKGLYEGAKNITTETGDALHEGITTGNWNRLKQDISKAEITVGNHPLQSALMFDGALNGTKSAIGTATDVAKSTVGDAAFFDTPTGQTIKTTLDRVNNARNNIAELFKNNSTLSEHEATISKLTQDAIDYNKKYTDAKNTLDSIKAQLDEAKSAQEATKGDLAMSAAEKEQHIYELKQKNIIAQKELNAAQDQLVENAKARYDEINKAIENQGKEALIKSGFDGTVSDLKQGLTDFAKQSFERESGFYKEFLGKAKVQAGSIIEGLENYKNELRKFGMRDSIPYVDKAINEFKLREIVNSGKNESAIYNDLINSGIDSKIWENLNIDELKKEYPSITSENMKTLRNTMYDLISKKSNEVSRQQYLETVKPAFDKAFEETILREKGQATVDRIKQIDANWAALKQNPIFKDLESISESKIIKNWDSFTEQLGKLPEGNQMIERVQNFLAERLIKNAEDPQKPGTYNYTKLAKEATKLEGVLGETIFEKISRVARDAKIIEEEKNLQLDKIKQARKSVAQTVSEETTKASKEVSEKKQSIKDINEKIKKIDKDAKAIGGDKPDFIKNIQNIDSPEKLQAFLEKTGKTPEEVGSVVARSAFKPIEEAISEGKFKPEMVEEALDKIEKLGKGDKEIRSQLVGPELESKIEKMRSEFDQWKAKNEANIKAGRHDKTLGKRAKDIAIGSAVVITMEMLGMGIGKFFGYRRILSGLTPSESTLAGLGEKASGVGKAIKALSPSKATLLKAGVAKNITDKEKEQ